MLGDSRANDAVDAVRNAGLNIIDCEKENQMK